MRGYGRPKMSPEVNGGTFSVSEGTDIVAYVTSNGSDTEIWCLLSGYTMPDSMTFTELTAGFMVEAAFRTWLSQNQGVDLSTATLQNHAITVL